MPNHPVALKFFPSNHRVVILTALRNPKPLKLKVLKTAKMIVTAPDGKCHPVVEGRGRLCDMGLGTHKWLIAVFRYDPTVVVECDPAAVRPGGVFGPSARLEITIKNEPQSGGSEQHPIIVDDTDPGSDAGPPVLGDVDLYA